MCERGPDIEWIHLIEGAGQSVSAFCVSGAPIRGLQTAIADFRLRDGSHRERDSAAGCLASRRTPLSAGGLWRVALPVAPANAAVGVARCSSLEQPASSSRTTLGRPASLKTREDRADESSGLCER